MKHFVNNWVLEFGFELLSFVETLSSWWCKNSSLWVRQVTSSWGTLGVFRTHRGGHPSPPGGQGRLLGGIMYELMLEGWGAVRFRQGEGVVEGMLKEWKVHTQLRSMWKHTVLGSVALWLLAGGFGWSGFLC